MPATSMAVTMAMVLPTMDTMDTHMPTIMDTTMARGLLMPSLLPLLSPPLMPMLTTDTTDIPLHTLTTDTDMPTMDTMDTHMPVTVTTMARGPLMPSLLLMLDTCMDTMDMDIDTDMPTTDTMDTHMPTMDTMDMESNHFVTCYQDFEDLAAVKLVRYLVTTMTL